MTAVFDEYGRPFIILRVRSWDHLAAQSPLQALHGQALGCRARPAGPAGGPDVVVRAQEQEKQKRIRGIDAQKANIQAARAITRILKSSLGPKGMDKMLQGPDGDVCISEPAWLCGVPHCPPGPATIMTPRAALSVRTCVAAP